jgi:outer membrane lipoprotein carrier protein
VAQDRQVRPPIDELVAALQAKYDSVRSFSAEFEHTYTGGVLRTALVERGTVQIQKPGKMRWSYTEPEEKLFVSDGTSLYSYIPFDQQVIVGTVPPENTASTPTLFLTGKGNLSDDFTAEYDEDEAPPDTWSIGLTPIRDNVDYTRLVLVVDRGTLSITQLRAEDFQGAVSTFAFNDLQENVGLPDSLFTFDIPSGTEVISEDSFRR